MKWLHNNIVDYKPESLSGCLALVLRPMSEVQQGRLKANQMFPDREILAMGVAEEANLRGINFVCSGSVRLIVLVIIAVIVTVSPIAAVATRPLPPPPSHPICMIFLLLFLHLRWFLWRQIIPKTYKPIILNN
jgi:hypothetical protein